MIDSIRKILRDLRWVVLDTRQEKPLSEGQIVVMLDDIDLVIEDTHTYRSYVWIVLEWDESKNVDQLPTKIAVLVHELQTRAEILKVPWANSFKFRKSEINRLGLTYRVSVYVEYVEVISV